MSQNTPLKLEVSLADRSYPILIGAEVQELIFDAVVVLQQDGRRIAWIADEGLYTAQPEFFNRMEALCPGKVLPRGEPTKCMEQFGAMLDFLAEERLDRTSCLLTLGGGVIGDLGGYVASSYLRGIDFYQVPTTLLAMVDSSVGGKTGINIKAGKNLVGAFHQPKAVFIDTSFLQTLEAREFSAGMAEVIKYGMLHDLELFERLEKLDTLHPTHPDLPSVIERCCATKAEIVAADERELAGSGGRALLNLGHTFGHAIENAAGYGEYLHGEAIAVGLKMAAELSQQLGCISAEEVQRVSDLLVRYELPVALRKPLKLEQLKNAMLRDKKVSRGKLRFVTMDLLGTAVTRSDIDWDVVEALWLKYGAEG